MKLVVIPSTEELRGILEPKANLAVYDSHLEGRRRLKTVETSKRRELRLRRLEGTACGPNVNCRGIQNRRERKYSDLKGKEQARPTIPHDR